MKKPQFIDKIANSLGYIKQVAVSSFGASELPAFPFSKTDDYLRSYAGWVFACVKARSEDVSGIKIKLYKIKDRKKGEIEEVTEHDALSLLRSVNPWQTKRELIEYTQAYKDLTGEAFWYLVKNGEEGQLNRKINQIWILRPDYITINPSKTEFIKDYSYRVPGQPAIIIPKDQIIHFKEFNPVDPYRGLGIVRAAALTIDTEQYSEEYNRKFFVNSAIPSIIMKTEQKLDESILKRMKSQWQAEYGGRNKSNKMAILEGGLELQPFSLSQKEMEFLEGQRYTRDKILAMFKTPKSVLGMTEGVTVSNAEATDIIFSKRVIKPLMEKFIDTLNEFLIIQYKDGDELFFGFDDPVPENKEAKLRFYETAFKVGAVSPNEIRASEGLDEVEGLDNYYLPMNVMPITGEMDDGEDKPVKGIRSNKLKGIVIPAKTLKQKIFDDVSEKISNDVIASMSKNLKKNEDARVDEKVGETSYTPEQQEAYWKQLIGKSVNFENRFKEKVVGIFKRQEKETIERLENTQKSFGKNDIDKVLFDLRIENKVTAEILVPVLRNFMEDSGEDTLDFLGIDDVAFDTTTATVIEFKRITALKGIKNMNKTTKSKLRKVLSVAVQEGKGIPEIGRDIRGIFADATRKRAERIARTEVLKAGNRGALEAYKQSGVVMGKQWFTSLDERVCEWCGPMHGRTKALDNNYFNQGESFIGNKGGKLDLNFDDVDTPPLHPMCRCTLIPITVSSRSVIIPNKKEKVSNVDINIHEIKEEIKKEVEDEMEKKMEKIIEEL